MRRFAILFAASLGLVAPVVTAEDAAPPTAPRPNGADCTLETSAVGYKSLPLFRGTVVWSLDGGLHHTETNMQA